MGTGPVDGSAGGRVLLAAKVDRNDHITGRMGRDEAMGKPGGKGLAVDRGVKEPAIVRHGSKDNGEAGVYPVGAEGCDEAQPAPEAKRLAAKRVAVKRVADTRVAAVPVSRCRCDRFITAETPIPKPTEARRTV